MMHTRTLLAALAGSVCVIAMAVPAAAQTRSYAISGGSLKAALDAYTRQSGRQVIYKIDEVRGARSKGAKGALSDDAALDAILAGSGFAARQDASGALAIVKNGQAAAANASDVDDQKGIPDILVRGSRSQNVDIARTEDDPQPYVVFDSKDIEKSGATNLEDFFRTRLPMNTQQTMNSQPTQNSNGANSGNVSAINLRGLGIQQTLILVDGKRAPLVANLPSDSFAITNTQADINGIPLSQIERIEVLPSTAGGIYGGGAIGGVINIIRKRDYRGFNLQIGVDGPFRGGGEVFRAALSGGFAIFEGRTRVSFSISQSKSNPLYTKDNDLWRRGRNLYYSNRPATDFFFGAATNVVAIGGGNLTLLDGTPLGSPRAFIPTGYRGLTVDGLAPLLATGGQINTELSDDPNGKFQTLRVGGKVRSATVNLRQEVASWLEAFVDVSISDNRTEERFSVVGSPTFVAAGAPNNPFQETVAVLFPQSGLFAVSRSLSKSQIISGGIIARLGRNWSANLEYSRSSQTLERQWIASPLTQTGYAALSDGTLDVFRDLNAFPLDLSPYLQTEPDSLVRYRSMQQVGSVRVSGKLFELPGGNLSLTAVAERRIETNPESRNLQTIGGQFGVSISDFVYPNRRQIVNSGYLELRAPLVSAGNGIPLVRELEIQASLRHDRYASNVPDPSAYDNAAPPPSVNYAKLKSRSTSYTIALRWQPTPDLFLRGSFATGFLPASIAQLGSHFSFRGAFPLFPDPRRGGEMIGTYPFQYDLGGNSSLRPETSVSRSIGAVFTPRALPHLRFSVDYTNIVKNGEIGSINERTLINSETSYPERIQRGPNLPGDQPGWAGPISLIDVSLINIAKSQVKALDFQADYTVKTARGGTIKFYAIATRQLKLNKQFRPDLAPFDTVDYVDGPLKWRGNGGIDWQSGQWILGWNVQFYSSYSVRLGANPTGFVSEDNVLAQGENRIPRQVYHDINIGYRFKSKSSALLDGVHIALGIQNVFDKSPPVIGSPSFGYSPYGDPRLRRFSFSLTKEFALKK